MPLHVLQFNNPRRILFTSKLHQPHRLEGHYVRLSLYDAVAGIAGCAGVHVGADVHSRRNLHWCGDRTPYYACVLHHLLTTECPSCDYLALKDQSIDPKAGTNLQKVRAIEPLLQ